MANNYLKQGIILFWALWFTIVTCSDFTSFLQMHQLIPDTFPFNSRNYDLIAQFLLVYGSHSHFFQQGISLVILLWALLITVSFWVSFIFKINDKFAYFAFNFSFSMTAFFILVDECFIKYDIEHGHLIRLSVQLLTFLVFMHLTTTKKNP